MRRLLLSLGVAATPAVILLATAMSNGSESSGESGSGSGDIDRPRLFISTPYWNPFGSKLIVNWINIERNDKKRQKYGGDNDVFFLLIKIYLNDFSIENP